jgi:hypothetical protein
MTDKEIIEECDLLKVVLLDYEDKTGVDVSRTIDRLANDTQIKIMKGVIKK